MKTPRLNTGYYIPVVCRGTNTFGKEGNVFLCKIIYDKNELRSAIKLGYRLIDIVIYYRNEAVIGKAVKESGTDRREFFITSKK
jgi:diketogulonate reductase-like aldo/keto reductase